MTEQKHIIISALGLDKPGIVSEISKTINNSKANIAESRMIKLGGDFSMMILVSTHHENLDLLLKNLNKINDITVHTHETKITSFDENELKEANIVLSGTDNEGLVSSLTEKLAEHDINIIEMNTGVMNAPMSGSTIFLLNALISHNKDTLDILKEELIQLSEELDVDIVLED
tara:strand:+ start:1566 stop:2084 length:519 start_codon:yes stop_codon:yes gene_type:complete